MHMPSRIIIRPLRFAIASASSPVGLATLYSSYSTLSIDIINYFIPPLQSSATVMEERIMPIQQE